MLPANPIKKINLTPAIKRVTQIVRPVIANLIVRQALVIALALITAYFLTASITGYFIYKRHLNNSWSRMVEQIFPYPALVVNGNITTLQRFRLEVSARQHYSLVHSIATNEHDTRQFVMDKLTNVVLYNEAIDQNAIILNEGDVTKKLEEIYTEVGGEEKLAKFLRENYGEQVDLVQFRTWIRESLVESAVQRQILTHAKVRHILVSIPNGATEEQLATSKQRALDIRSKITEIGQFSDIAKQFSEDIGSRDKGGELGTTVQGDSNPVFSQAFEDAIFTMPLNQTSEPVLSSFGWHIIVVDSREGSVNMSTKEYTEQLRKDAKIKQFLTI